MTEKKKKKSETGDQAGDDGRDQTQVKKIVNAADKKSKPAKKTTYATKTNDEYLFSFGNLFK